MWYSRPEQKICHLSIRENENVDVGNVNIEVAEFLPTLEVLTPGAEMTYHFDLDRDNMLILRAWAKVMKEKIGDTSVRIVAVPIAMSRLSMREVASRTKRLGMFNTMNELESEMQSLCAIRASVSRPCLKLTHNPKTLLGKIDK